MSLSMERLKNYDNVHAAMTKDPNNSTGGASL